MRSAGVLLLAAASALALAACGGEAREPQSSGTGRVVGLASSLPLVLPESADIADLLADSSPPHWALAVLREQGKLESLDSLTDATGAVPLPADAVLVLAQPWPLSPQENVALDTWVRGGGRVLLFADPLLTFPSQFALGDRRRPQDVATLSPILTRWGLRLERDEDLPPAPFVVELDGAAVPVALPGRFALLEGSQCKLAAQAMLADCRIGRGRVVAFADAALLEGREDDSQGSHAAALRVMLARLMR